MNLRQLIIFIFLVPVPLNGTLLCYKLTRRLLLKLPTKKVGSGFIDPLLRDLSDVPQAYNALLLQASINAVHDLGAQPNCRWSVLHHPQIPKFLIFRFPSLLAMKFQSI